MLVTPMGNLAPHSARDNELWATAQKLEAAFLSEMLKSAGVGRTPGAFGGGAGEEQFASFLRDEEARAMAAHGGVGLTQSIFDSIKRSDADAD